MEIKKEINQNAIRETIEKWALATRTGKIEKVLENHSPELVIFDVLPPIKYTNAAEYKASWDDWQPDTKGEGIFNLHDLVVEASDEVGFGYCLIQCGGTLADGKKFEDWVRATFCLLRISGNWTIVHQHVSKPMNMD
jgi:ketosteroid isomerase-like protein